MGVKIIGTIQLKGAPIFYEAIYLEHYFRKRVMEPFNFLHFYETES